LWFLRPLQNCRGTSRSLKSADKCTLFTTYWHHSVKKTCPRTFLHPLRKPNLHSLMYDLHISNKLNQTPTHWKSRKFNTLKGIDSSILLRPAPKQYVRTMKLSGCRPENTNSEPTSRPSSPRSPVTVPCFTLKWESNSSRCSTMGAVTALTIRKLLWNLVSGFNVVNNGRARRHIPKAAICRIFWTVRQFKTSCSSK
jgi:hypothetical protein